MVLHHLQPSPQNYFRSKLMIPQSLMTDHALELIHLCNDDSVHICMKANSGLSILPLEKHRKKSQENLSSFLPTFTTVHTPKLNSYHEWLPVTFSIKSSKKRVWMRRSDSSLSLICYVSLYKSLSLSNLQCPHLLNEKNKTRQTSKNHPALFHLILFYFQQLFLTWAHTPPKLCLLLPSFTGMHCSASLSHPPITVPPMLQQQEASISLASNIRDAHPSLHGFAPGSHPAHAIY